MITRILPFQETLDLARKDFAKGHIDDALMWLYHTRQIAINTGFDIPNTAISGMVDSARASGADIEAAYRRLVQEELRGAEYSASSFGYLDGVIMHLDTAREYAANAGVEVPKERIKDIFGTAYKNRISEQVRNAGHGVDIPATTLSRIEELAYQDGVKAAEKYIGA